MTDVATDVQTEQPTTEAPTESAPTETASDFSIPEAYAERGYAKEIKSSDDLWKKLDGSQKLIGDRGAFIPQEGATSDEVDAFLSKLDPYSEQLKSKYAPKAPETYEFSDLELPEGTAIADSVTEKFSAIAKTHGLTNEQADSVRKEWIAHEVEQAGQRESQLNEQFESMAKEKWGDDWAKVTAEASEVLKGHVPENMREAMVNMPNEYLIPLVSVMQSMKAKPDGIPNTSGAQTLTDDDARAKYSELRQKAMKDPRARKTFEEFQDKYRHQVNKR